MSGVVFLGNIGGNPNSKEMLGWSFEPKTMTIDLESASLSELSDALRDCRHCIAVEYPETEHGTMRALERQREIKKWLHRRFPEQALLVESGTFSSAMAMSKLAHP